jgi:hypothetical protein
MSRNCVSHTLIKPKINNTKLLLRVSLNLHVTGFKTHLKTLPDETDRVLKSSDNIREAYS